jgi:DNA-binding MarR family transcriptional regulator/transcriptional regulator with XRE-family HTH domain
VLFLTGRSGRLAELLTQRVIRPHQLDSSQLAVLVALASAGEDGGLSPGDLSALLAQTRSGITRTVKRLERDRLVDRGPNPSDGRAVLLRLTTAGDARMARAMNDLLEQFEAQLDAAPRVDVLGLVRALEQVDGLFEQLPGAGLGSGGEVVSRPNPGAEGATIGDRIRRLRLDAGLTQRALADRVGASAPHLSKIESSKEHPSAELLTRLAAALDTDADHLLLAAGIVPDWIAEAMANDPERAIELARALRPPPS